MVTIYVFQCEDNKYYVGRTENPDVRIENHMAGNGSAWTKKYRPLKIIERNDQCDVYDEDKYVIKYMSQHGIENVRGGSYSQIELSSETVNQLQKSLANAMDKCFNCQEIGHFVSQCPKRRTSNLDTIDEGNEINPFEIDDSYKLLVEDSEGKESKPLSFWNRLVLCCKKRRNNQNWNEERSNQTWKKKQKRHISKGKCFRCGRYGHWIADCYAKKDVRGRYLSPPYKANFDDYDEYESSESSSDDLYY